MSRVDNQNRQLESNERSKIIRDALRKRHVVVSTNLKDIFIDPNTSGETDKGKLLLTLDVEMVEEGVRIRQVKNKDGSVVEEVVFE